MMITGLENETVTGNETGTGIAIGIGGMNVGVVETVEIMMTDHPVDVMTRTGIVVDVRKMPRLGHRNATVMKERVEVEDVTERTV